MMVGDGWMVAVFFVRPRVMCCLGVSCRACANGGDVSFSWQGGGRRAGLYLLFGLAAGAGWQGHLPAEGAGCLLLSALFLYLLVGRTLCITKTCLYNFDPLKPHFYIVKLGFTGVYIIFKFLL